MQNSWSLPDLQSKDTGELPTLQVYRLEPLPRRKSVLVTNRGTPADDKVETTKSEDSVDENDGKTDNKNDTSTEVEEEDETDSEDDSSKEDEDEIVANGDKKTKDEFAHARRVDINNEPISNAETKNEEQAPDVKFSFLAISQRRTEMTTGEMLHPFTHQVFGTPLLLRVVDLEGYSGRDLYDLVARRMRSFVPKAALRFLAADHKDDPREEEGASYLDQSVDSIPMPRAGSRKRRHRTTTDMEEVAAGPVPRYGFRLRLTSRDGKRCALCPWYECCIGCLVPDDDYPTIVTCGDSLVIDWHFAVDIATSGFGFRSNQLDSPSGQGPARAKQLVVPVRSHSSYGDGSKKKGSAGVVTLEQCLDAFAEEERIPEASRNRNTCMFSSLTFSISPFLFAMIPQAYCSRCQDFRVQTKRMSLWRLPPVIIIHLKRFQFTQHARRKLRDLVTFPIEGLDLSRIMASDPSTSVTNVKLNGKDDDATVWIDDDSSSTEKEQDVEESSPPNAESSDSPSKDGMLYDLYGVVHHQGALSGGHYVASLKSEIDGQWRLFNDAQVFDIHSRDIVDSSAYILFYIRRDAKGARLEDFWDTVPREGEGLTEEEMDKLMKGRSDRCVIS